MLAGPRTKLARPPTKRVADQVYLEETVDQHQAYHVINLKLLACYYCENGGDYSHCSEANAHYNPPHPTTHIYGSLRPVRYYYYLIWLALCFSVTSSIASVMATSAMSLTYLTVLLMSYRDRLMLWRSGNLPFSMAIMMSSSNV
ncbi:MAG: hypothetical protein M3299_07810 [Thermoproteota archaeon]|nr:hypothetical protein [Thermoproteota archaeon]